MASKYAKEPETGKSALRNPKHERMAQVMAEGKTQMDAYKAAGFVGDPQKHAAGTLKRHPQIRARIAVLLEERARIAGETTAKAAEEAAVDKAWVLNNLREVAERCMQAKPVMSRGKPVFVETPEGGLAPAYVFDSAGANRALELVGKELGMFIDRKEIRTGPLDGLSHAELKELQEMLSGIDRRESAGEDPGATAPRVTH